MSRVTKNICSKFSKEAEITFTLTESALTIKQINIFSAFWELYFLSQWKTEYVQRIEELLQF